MVSLDSLKYAELQRLAKSVGLKANVKCEKLLKALKEHYAQEQTAANANESGDVDARDDSSRSVFVTERRQKCRLAKRRLSDAVQNEEPEDKKERHDKRRKVSSTVTAESLVKAVESKENSSITNDASIEPSEKAVGRRTAGKIPRHEGLMKNKSSLRPTTPNFKKLHEAQFKKMESIDSYVQRKNKRMEVKKPPVNKSSLFSPEVEKKQIPKRKSALKENSIFRPTVLTTNKINVRFSQATHDNEYKCSSVKTPARMSPFVPLTSTPGRKSGVNSKLELKSVGAINKTPGVTPFVFGENTSMSATPGTSKKNVFDLKASLSRPLTYKPHKGKLKPFGAGTEDTTLNKSQTVPSHQKNFKQHQIQTREQRRTERAEDRNQRKEKLMAARRGLIMA